MYKISVKDHFSAAHFLENYPGNCGSIHGHRWEVIVSTSIPKNSETSMLIDFSEFKKALGEIVSDMDHAFIIDPKGDLRSREFYSVLKKYGICRICFRELAYKGQIPGFTKSSW